MRHKADDGKKLTAVRRFVHANARLRTRWGMELTWEEYEEVNKRFRLNSGIKGRQVNSRGDIEGWVKIKDKQIPCVFSVKDGVVATFFAPPPGWEGEDDLKEKYAALKSDYSALKTEHNNLLLKFESIATKNQTLRTQHREAQERADLANGAFRKLRSEEEENEKRLLKQAEHIATKKANILAAADNKEARWLKDASGKIADAVYHGHFFAAFLALNAVCAMPKSFRFSKNDEESNKALASWCEQKLDYMLNGRDQNERQRD